MSMGVPATSWDYELEHSTTDPGMFHAYATSVFLMKCGNSEIRFNDVQKFGILRVKDFAIVIEV